MNLRSNKLVVIFCLFTLSCATSKTGTTAKNNLAAIELKPFGRYVVNNQQNIELVSSAVHFGFSFEGDACELYVSLPNNAGHNYLQFELDGKYQKRLRVEGNATKPVVISAGKSGKHTVWIYKATEAHTGAIIIEKITGKNVKALERPAAPLIEFIGNSITCGAAADPSEVPCGAGQYHDQHNAYLAYGPRVAREIGANYILSSVSGIGVYRNWNSDGPTMPEVYEKVDFQTNSQLWNFNKYSPRVVSIALGTNDLSRGDGVKKRLPFDSAAYVGAYIKFVQLVKSKYPTAQIALLSSPMAGGNRTLLQNCIAAVKQGIDNAYPSDKKVAIFFFQPMNPRGCAGHPNVEDHGIMAKQLVPFFKGLL